MSKQKTAGLVLLLVSILFTLLLIKFENINWSYYFGLIIGRTAVLTLIIFLLISPFRKLRKKASSILIVSASLCLSSLSTFSEVYSEKTSDKKLKNDIVDTFDSYLNDDKEITKITKETSFNDVFKNYIAKINNIRNRYESDLKQADMESVLSPNNLTSKTTLSKSKNRLKSFKGKIPKYESEFLSEMKTLETKLSKRTDKDSVAAYRGFMRNKSQGEQEVKSLYANQYAMVSQAEELVDFMLSIDDKEVTVENNQVLFSRQEHLDAYNMHFFKLTKLSIEEQHIINKNRNKLENKINELKNTK